MRHPDTSTLYCYLVCKTSSAVHLCSPFRLLLDSTITFVSFLVDPPLRQGAWRLVVFAAEAASVTCHSGEETLGAHIDTLN
jgi:hypothetical protein